ADLHVVRRAADDSLVSNSFDPFGIVRMGFGSGRAHDALPPLLERAAEVRERRAIGVQALAFGSQDGDELRREVEYLPEFHFALAQGRRQLLLFGDVDSRSDKPDRKSTRLNSSHDQISYAVFCLKKKR